MSWVFEELMISDASCYWLKFFRLWRKKTLHCLRHFPNISLVGAWTHYSFWRWKTRFIQHQRCCLWTFVHKLIVILKNWFIEIFSFTTRVNIIISTMHYVKIINKILSICFKLWIGCALSSKSYKYNFLLPSLESSILPWDFKNNKNKNSLFIHTFDTYKCHYKMYDIPNTLRSK